ncbi:translation initiation factor 2 [Kitasatospora sp. NA04385]|uniref:translation initiation factor 2 n=1 Tax=Kitasatospora sp. NA04385 TaxID=2742135 RepID=UPI0015909AEC|nr:translation initiation factor 2 [Kitasatospora sp. NA04385]QKW22956.1 translation initiation factor 2 [Kitasatospora sp. NA04385]
MPDHGRNQKPSVLLAFRSAVALHRLLDVLPVFEGDPRIERWFTLVPGSRFGADALAVLDRAGARVVDFDEARGRRFDLILSTSPKGALTSLSGRARALLPHGAGFNKALGDEGSPGLPSGLDPAYLLAAGEPWADLHGLGHHEQLARLTEFCPPAAARAVVVGDPTLDRMRESTGRRDAYRRRLGAGDRTLLAVLTTWGPEGLLARRHGLPLELALHLPVDDYLVALVVHPNEVSARTPFDLAEQLGPALRAGLLLPSPHQEWASVLVAADAVLTDHGSTALYAAALGRTVVLDGYDGGSELLPGTPMARLLAAAPRFTGAADLPGLLRAATVPDPARLAVDAFARPGEALGLLRAELYRLLGLAPPRTPLTPALLPDPVLSRPAVAALSVRAEVDGARVRLERFPVATGLPVHHRSAHHGAAGLTEQRSAEVLWRRPGTGRWSAAGWAAHVLDELPGCRLAAALLSPELCLLVHRRHGPFALHVPPHRADGRIRRIDPAAAASAAYAWLAAHPRPAGALPVGLDCTVGPVTTRLELAAAGPAELDAEF